MCMPIALVHLTCMPIALPTGSVGSTSHGFTSRRRSTQTLCTAPVLLWPSWSGAALLAHVGPSTDCISLRLSPSTKLLLACLDIHLWLSRPISKSALLSCIARRVPQPSVSRKCSSMTSGVPKGKPQVSDLSHCDGLDGLQLNVTVRYRIVTGGLHACPSQPFTGEFF